MTVEPDNLATAVPAYPPAGAIQRIAADLLDMLADDVTEQPEASLDDLFASNTAFMAEVHLITYDPWVRDGIETAALLALAITALPQPVDQLRRENLAARFSRLPAGDRRIWAAAAADLLHATNRREVTYGPLIGEYPHTQTRPADDDATARRPETSEPVACRDHTIEQGTFIQTLPACLAPSPIDYGSQPSIGLPSRALPNEDDAVVIAHGHVMYLTTDGSAEVVTREDSCLWGAPLIGEGCGAARWDTDSVTVLDPRYPGLQDTQVEAIETAWTLLLDYLGRIQVGGGSR
jgi:hypothetical protein